MSAWLPPYGEPLTASQLRKRVLAQLVLMAASNGKPAQPSANGSGK